MQYKRDELFTWEDFICETLGSWIIITIDKLSNTLLNLYSFFTLSANLGGVMSLCLGFSLLSLIEVIYFFTMRQVIDRTKRKRAVNDQIDQVIIPSIYVSKNYGMKSEIFGLD